MVRSLSENATPDDMAALLEDIENKLTEKEIFKQKNEELKKKEAERLREIETNKKAAEEE